MDHQSLEGKSVVACGCFNPNCPTIQFSLTPDEADVYRRGIESGPEGAAIDDSEMRCHFFQWLFRAGCAKLTSWPCVECGHSVGIDLKTVSDRSLTCLSEPS